MVEFKEGLYADVRVEHCFSTDISYQNGQLRNRSERKVSGAFIRVFDGERWYYSSTQTVEDVPAELARLYALAKEGADVCHHPLIERLQVNREEIYAFTENDVRNIPLEEKDAFLTSLLPSLTAVQEGKMWMARYSDRHNIYEFTSSLGAHTAYDTQTCGITAFVAMGTEEGKVYQHAFQKGNIDYAQLKAEVPTLLQDSLEEGVRFLKEAVPVEPGRYPVILSPLAAGIFAHESFGHKSEADFMLGDETLKKEWAIGKKVGSDILSIVDTGIPFGSGYVPFDDEGTKATKTYLIRNGVLTGRLHSAETAAALGEGVTGNARAMSTAYEPIVRMTNTYIEGGQDTLEELIGKVQHGYFIKTVSHGSGMSTFTLAPAISYEIVDGKLGKPVNISVITGTVFDTLGKVAGLTKEVELLSFVSGGCGKMEQYPLPVGFGAPYVLVREMNVQ